MNSIIKLRVAEEMTEIHQTFSEKKQAETKNNKPDFTKISAFYTSCIKDGDARRYFKLSHFTRMFQVISGL